MNWLPIYTYDDLKKKPELAAFYFEATGTTRGKLGNTLSATVQLTRFYGSRVCTHWCPLPDTEELDKGGESMSKKALAAGTEFGAFVVDLLRRTGVPDEGRVVFYATEIGIQLGNIAAHIGKDATLVVLDALRGEIANLPDKEAGK